MKHSELRTIVHNVADSLGSGIGLMIGNYEMDVYGEARRSTGGGITVDFLQGVVIEGEASISLGESVALYKDAFASLCSKVGVATTEFAEAKARFWSDATGGRFTIIVMGQDGHRSATDYAGTPGRRVKVLDSLGRIRPKPSA